MATWPGQLDQHNSPDSAERLVRICCSGFLKENVRVTFFFGTAERWFIGNARFADARERCLEVSHGVAKMALKSENPRQVNQSYVVFCCFLD